MRIFFGAVALLLLASAASAASAQSISGNIGGGSLSGDNSSANNLRGEIQGGVAISGDGNRGNSADLSFNRGGGDGATSGLGTFYGDSARAGSLFSGDTSTLPSNRPYSYFGDSAFAGSMFSGQQSPDPNAPITYGR